LILTYEGWPQAGVLQTGHVWNPGNSRAAGSQRATIRGNKRPCAVSAHRRSGLSLQIGPNFHCFAIGGRPPVAPRIPMKILHGKIVALVQPWAATDSGHSIDPMSQSLTRLTLRSLVLGVLQCETASSRKEIRDLVR